MRAAVLIICAATLAPHLYVAAARAGGDVEAGRILAVTWCSTCHAMAGGPPASDAAPALGTVARSAAAAPERVRLFLTAPHGGMPDLTLSRRDIDNLVAYLATLR